MLGVDHMDEVLYLFPQRDFLFPTTLPTKDEDEVRKAMVEMWTDFARTGYDTISAVFILIAFNGFYRPFRNPTPKSSYLPKWKKLKEFPINYYRIGNLNFENKPMFGNEYGGMFEDRAKFWRELGAHLPAANVKKDEL